MRYLVDSTFGWDSLESLFITIGAKLLYNRPFSIPDAL
jgi:hypothetical protein